MVYILCLLLTVTKENLGKHQKVSKFKNMGFSIERYIGFIFTKKQTVFNEERLKQYRYYHISIIYFQISVF